MKAETDRDHFLLDLGLAEAKVTDDADTNEETAMQNQILQSDLAQLQQQNSELVVQI